MGAAVGQCLRGNAHRVSWVRAGRSAASRARAAQFETHETLVPALRDAELVVSICPPGNALEVAQAVASAGYRGTYLDANAIAPATMRRIAALDGLDCVDGGIIGPPPLKHGTTRLYLSGPDAALLATRFSGSALEAIAMNGNVGAASALKACYATWTKGSSALLGAIRALAQAESVDDALIAEWNRSQPGLAPRSEAILGQRHKAWRWVDEMHEIAASFESQQLPGGFHQAAAELFARLEQFKDDQRPTNFSSIVAALMKPATKQDAT